MAGKEGDVPPEGAPGGEGQPQLQQELSDQRAAQDRLQQQLNQESQARTSMQTQLNQLQSLLQNLVNMQQNPATAPVMEAMAGISATTVTTSMVSSVSTSFTQGEPGFASVDARSSSTPYTSRSYSTTICDKIFHNDINFGLFHCPNVGGVFHEEFCLYNGS